MYISVCPVEFNDEELELIRDYIPESEIGGAENTTFNDDELEYIYECITEMRFERHISPCYADKYGEDPEVVIMSSILKKIIFSGIFN